MGAYNTGSFTGVINISLSFIMCEGKIVIP